MGMVAAVLALAPALASSAAWAGGGDPVRGERVFQRCYACHSVDPAETGLPGPNLHGVIGRPAASLPDFEYSPAFLAARGLVWDERTLDAFIKDPQEVVPDNEMGFFGLADMRDRADLIAFLGDVAVRD